jgi:hypothetical protein
MLAMSIAINSNFERDQLVASFTGQTQFFYSFPIYADTFLTVYRRGANDVPDDPTQELMLGVDYTVSGAGQEGGGFITLIVGATIGDIITIVGTQPIERESVFQDLNPFTVALNQQLNQMTIMIQQIYTYWANLTPHYNFDELVSAPQGFSVGVRPFKLILPMLPDGHVWVGRGSLGTIPDDITTMPLTGAGTGNVIAAHPGMRQSISLWTGTDFILTDSNLNIVGDLITPTVGTPTNSDTGFDDTWGAFHWPAHVTGNRPLLPANGDVYYDTTLQQFFGYQNGAWVPFGTGNTGNNTQVKTIIQANAFTPGEWVRIDAGSNLYVLALGDTPQDAETWWMVTAATATQFTIQGGVSWVDLSTFSATPPGLLPLTIGVPYYISDMALGEMTTVPPALGGEVNKPVFIADSATTGWILSARGYIIGTTSSGGGATTTPNYVNVTGFVNTFALGDVIYATGSNTYALATAQGTFAQADNIGVVSTIGSPNFTYQTEGNAIGIITQDELGAAIVPGVRYWLSDNPAHPGKVTAVKPTTLNHYTAPIYQPYAATAGVITRQRPLIITSPAQAGGNQLIATLNLNNQADTGASFLGIFDGTYQDIVIVGENIIMRNTATNQYYGQGVAIQLEVSGVLKTDADYNFNGMLSTDFPFSSSPALQCWTNDNNNALTIGGKNLDFKISSYGIDATNTYKIFDVNYNYFGALNTTYPLRQISGQPQNIFTYGSSLNHNKGAITGFKMLFDPASGGIFQFVSGTISVYGTAT